MISLFIPGIVYVAYGFLVFYKLYFNDMGMWHVKICFVIGLIVLTARSLPLLAQEEYDTAKVLTPVTISADKKVQRFFSINPAQLISRQLLQQLNAASIGDVTKYFSGVLVKDYGGVGGLKTVSVRGLGAGHTVIIYDGVPISDLQSGQIDLSKFSSTFIESVGLYNAQQSSLPATAGSYAAAAVLAIHTPAFFNSSLVTRQNNFQAGTKFGSFGLVQPFAALTKKISEKTFVSFNTEGVLSKGNYPFISKNGNIIENKRRKNSQVKSLQAELNILTLFADSATLQLKSGACLSKRGLPGAVIFFNDHSVQSLTNADYFFQARYKKAFSSNTIIVISTKYSYLHTYYQDPDFLNGSGGLKDKYNQQEWYLSGAVSQIINKNILLGLATDISKTWLYANKNNFAKPDRLSCLNAVSVNYNKQFFRINAAVVINGFFDNTQNPSAADGQTKLTPYIAASWKSNGNTPWMLRAFYKHIFRMPTFNDLYYNFIGNRRLKPEDTKQFGAGIVWSKKMDKKIQSLTMSVDGYFNLVKDKIVAIPNQNLFVWSMMNFGKAAIIGTDVSADANGFFTSKITWLARVAYTWQQAKNIIHSSSQNTKNRIPYSPDHSGSGIFTVYYKAWSIGMNSIFSGKRYTDGGNSDANKLAGWSTQDIFISNIFYSKKLQLQLKAAMNNITNQHYDIVRYYPMPGRSFDISIIISNNKSQ